MNLTAEENIFDLLLVRLPCDHCVLAKKICFLKRATPPADM